MAEILIKATDATHPDPAKDRRGCYKRGMPVVVMPDGHPWGAEERLPTFALLKVPLVPVARVEQYVEAWTDVQRRRWRIRWADLPLATRTKWQTTGELIIRARLEYLGPFDHTWAQVKAFFRNDETGLDETGDP